MTTPDHAPLRGRRVTQPVCPAGECDGYGCVWTDPHICTCGVGPSGYYGMHEPYCGAEPCPVCEFTSRQAIACTVNRPHDGTECNGYHLDASDL